MILVGINPDAAKIACAGGTPDPIRLFARMLPVCGADRNIALRDVVVDGRALALLRVAVASAPGRLHQKTLAGLHLVTARRRRFELVRRAEPHHEPAASARSAACEPLWGKARF